MNGTTMKLLALALMLIDHIGEFIPGLPVWLRWLGRLSAPLFTYCMIWGLYYTRDRKRYLWNLYGWSAGMAVGDVALSALFRDAPTLLMNNIFTTFLLIGILVALIEALRGPGRKRAVLLLFLFIAVQAVSLVVCSLVDLFFSEAVPAAFVLPASLLPSVLFCEGGPFWIAAGVAMYFVRASRWKLCVVYVLFTLLLVWSPGVPAYTLNFLLYENYQWMMIGSLPLMLCYNGQKGRGLKWLFYAFYPAHVFILFVVGNLL